MIYEDGTRKHRHHQLLTNEIGNPHLEKQVVAVTTLMRVARDWGEFVDLFERSDPHARHQLRLALNDADDDDDDRVSDVTPKERAALSGPTADVDRDEL
jgi:hypothetical protein